MENLYEQSQSKYQTNKDGFDQKRKERAQRYQEENQRLADACQKFYDAIMSNVRDRISRRQDYGCANIFVYDYPTKVDAKHKSNNPRNVFFNPETCQFQSTPDKGLYSTVHLLNGNGKTPLQKYFGVRKVEPVLNRLEKELAPFKLYHGFPNPKAGNVIQVRWDDVVPRWAVAFK